MTKPNIDITLAASYEDKTKCYMVRAIVYMEEQHYQYSDEFDGNDEFSTHILACVDGEPAGTLRLRYFGEFVKVERVAVRTKFRTHGLGHAMLKFAEAFVARKGFTNIYGTINARLAKFWSRAGCQRTQSKPEFADANQRYVPFQRRLKLDRRRLTIDTPDHVLGQTEGQWELPDLLEDDIAVPDALSSRIPTKPADVLAVA